MKLQPNQLNQMKIKTSKESDPNYLASVVKITNISPHPNADKLEITKIFGNDIIIGKGLYAIGDICIYFPVECCISRKFLSWANLLDKPELNSDGETKGFFGKQSRVKAISLRGIPSQGFLYKVSELSKYYGIDSKCFKFGDTFDTVGEDLLVYKYVRNNVKNSDSKTRRKFPRWLNFVIRLFPNNIQKFLFTSINSLYGKNKYSILSRIPDKKFNFHYKTEQLGKNIWLVKPDDYITIKPKFHGTSAIFSNMKLLKSFSIINLIKDIFNIEYDKFEYKLLYSSRSVLKNRKDGQYTNDVWGINAQKLDGVIPPNYAVYGEIVGFTPSGGAIQKKYDYGVTNFNNELYVYRLTFTDPVTNKTSDLNSKEIEKFCDQYDLMQMPRYYSGPAKNLFDIPIDDNWSDTFLNKLKDTFLDKKCEFCNNNVINEGIVLRLEDSDAKKAFKFKSPKFLVEESSNRDNNEVDIEEEN